MMTREEILAGVEKLRPWFHQIDLGGGILTKTQSAVGEPVDHPRPTWEHVRTHLPEDLSGRSLLDVGCNAGFYCFEAARRGAARVVGVDAQRHLVRQARFVGRALRLPGVAFEKLSVYDLDPAAMGGQFDVALALGLVYHCKHLVLALERLFRVTRSLLILETAVFPPTRSPGSFAHPVGGMESVLHPLGYVENPPGMKEAIYNWFLPSPEALRALLLNVGFDEVETHPGAGPERAIVVARKSAPYPDSRALHFLSASITLVEPAESVRASEEIAFRVAVRNDGFARWLSEGEEGTARGAVRLAAHLIRGREEEDILLYYAGAVLPRDVEPGEAVELTLRLRAPAEPGPYVLEFDMVSEHLSWFEDLGSPTVRHALVVVG
jgi:tRNA (mo5U34)-methyltransferase